MSINFYYGLNGSYKTRTLLSLYDKCKKDILKIATNLEGKDDAPSENLNSISLLQDSPFLAMYDNRFKTPQYKKIESKIAEEVLKAILSDADILILDEIETIFTYSQLYIVFGAIQLIQSQFKEIHIATHSSVPLSIFDTEANYFLCNKNLVPEEVPRDTDIFRERIGAVLGWDV